MKCPRCNYVSFDSMPRCKKCGFQFKPARAQQEPMDIKSLFSDLDVKSGETQPADKDSNLKKTVASIRESLAEIDGQSGAESGGEARDGSLAVDTDVLQFRVDSGYMDTSKQFPDHSEINWEESISLSNDNLTLPFHEGESGEMEHEGDQNAAGSSDARTDNLQGTLRQISEELKEIEEEPHAVEEDLKEIEEEPFLIQPAADLNSILDDAAVASNSKAGFWIRALAYLIDTAILDLLAIILLAVGIIALGMVSPGLGELDEERILGLLGPYYLFSTIITIFYFTYFHGSIGQTPGKMLCGLKVVRVNGEALGYGRAFLRWVGYLPSGWIFCLGFLWIVWDKHKQAWHDKIAGSCVIKV